MKWEGRWEAAAGLACCQLALPTAQLAVASQVAAVMLHTSEDSARDCRGHPPHQRNNSSNCGTVAGSGSGSSSGWG